MTSALILQISKRKIFVLTFRRKISVANEDENDDVKDAFCSIKPDEVPEVPTSKFLSRVSDNKFVY